MDMELGTWSILVQLLLIFVLVAVFAGRRHLRSRRDTRQPPTSMAPAPHPPAAARSPMPPRPVLTDLPPELPLELVHPSFTDTCADWAPVAGADAGAGPGSGSAARVRFSLSDWSAPTDRVALDSPPDPAELVWAERTPTPMSCTIAPQAQHCT